MASRLRIGVIGAGDNTRTKHIPGLRAERDVEIVAVCNRRPESTERVAREYDIPRRFGRWEELVGDPGIDAVVIGTWPYLHCPITLAALAAGKHVLTEARMSLNAAEAHRMRQAAQAHPKLVTQIVPSPIGLAGDRLMREMIQAGYLGEIREYHVYSQNGALADPKSPLAWRQDAGFSGFNALSLGILHETLLRWLPQPSKLFAQTRAFIAERLDSGSGLCRPVETPDSIQVVTRLDSGAAGVYRFSGVSPFDGGMAIELSGSEGWLRYDLAADKIYGAREQASGAGREIAIPADKRGGWRVEADFVRSIREGTPVEFTNFDSGVAYMEFTEAVARSALNDEVVELPLADFIP